MNTHGEERHDARIRTAYLLENPAFAFGAEGLAGCLGRLPQLAHPGRMITRSDLLNGNSPRSWHLPRRFGFSMNCQPSH